MRCLSSILLPLLMTGLAWLDPQTVKPRQTGVCITEWDGGERWEIPVEVVGVMDAQGPERTAVLVRLADPRFAEQGVVAGMSGSPVYLDGKLLGAVAFGWSFAREPLAGVTPFATMRTLEPSPVRLPVPPPTLEQLTALARGELEPLSVLPELPGGGSSTPLLVSVGGLPLGDGFPSRLLARAGLQGVPSGGRIDLAGIPEAGEMVAALLVWGDATLAAGGTVTAREGDRVWAFGHPLFSLGGVRLPATRARVLAVQRSYMSPFKLFAVGQEFGAFVADREPGILAVAGEAPPGLPIAVTVREQGAARTWNYRVAQVPILMPLMATYVTNASLTARGAAAGDATVRVRLHARLEDGRELRVTQEVGGPDALARVASFTGGVVSFLENSPFPHPALTSLDVELDRAEQLMGAAIAEAIPARTVVRPGERVQVEVRLRPYQGAPTTRRLTVQVPAAQPPGRLDLIVADGAAWSDYRMKQAALQPASFAQQLEQLAMLEPSSTLVLALETRDAGLAGPGMSQPALPPSWSATLATGLGRSAVTRLSTATVATARWGAPYPLEGAFRIALTVRPQEL